MGEDCTPLAPSPCIRELVWPQLGQESRIWLIQTPA